MPRKRSASDPHAAWLASLHPALRMLAQWPGWLKLHGGFALVACSGGRDSVALAHCAWTLLHGQERDSFSGYLSRRESERPKLQAQQPAAFQLPQLLLWHFDHGLRPESGEDARFVRELGEQWAVRVIAIGRESFPMVLPAELKNVMARARRLRYAALFSTMHSPGVGLTSRPRCCLIAHHLQDQAETVLFNLIRGTGYRGLRGIAREDWQDDWDPAVIERPWLDLHPRHIAGYCAAKQIAWREDATNSSVRRRRGFIRHRLLPLIEELNPQAIEHIAHAGFDIQELDAAFSLDRVADCEFELTEEHRESLLFIQRLPLLSIVDFHCQLLPKTPSTSFRAWLELEPLVSRFCGPLNRQQINSFREWMADPRGSWSFRSAVFSMGRGLLAVERADERGCPAGRKEAALREGTAGLGVSTRIKELSGPLTPELQSVLAGSPRISNWWDYLSAQMEHWRAYSKAAHGTGAEAYSEMQRRLTSYPTYCCLLPESVEQPLKLRAWRTGDRIELAGAAEQPGRLTKKLSDVFIDAKIPRTLRGVWAILCDANDRVLWVPGLADSHTMHSALGESDRLFVTLRPGDRHGR